MQDAGRKAGISHEVLQALTILGGFGRVESWKGWGGGCRDGRTGSQAACLARLPRVSRLSVLPALRPLPNAAKTAQLRGAGQGLDYLLCAQLLSTS